ncbi:MAG: metal-dependent hydrolase [Acidobacteria bacterium]|nr:metal-dependent hydrolase [Acidobacteriota bacterium]
MGTRRISFEESLTGLPKYFACDEDLIMSHAIGSLSAVFPDGEDYFVRSVRAFRDEIVDPELRAQVSGFIGQEAMHGREHRLLNDRLDELGYPTKRVERFTRWGLSVRERVMSPTANLATTAALEHFTATLAEIILSDPEARRLIGSREVVDLFLWHALEECEHKAVAFDVFKAVGGTERTRVWIMNYTTFTFLGGMALQVAAAMARDRSTYRAGRLRSSLRRLRSSPFLRREVWDQLRDYNRRDFHPDDRDTDMLLGHWRDDLFGPNGRLNDKIVKSS